MEIVKVKTNSPLADELYALLKSEWPEFEGFKLEKSGLAIPDPIISLVNGKLVGGLSFTTYKKPMSEDVAIWINAVFVTPKYRRKGIASKLIEKSQGVRSELFALTDIPEIYTNLGWKIAQKDSHGTTVKTT